MTNGSEEDERKEEEIGESQRESKAGDSEEMRGVKDSANSEKGANTEYTSEAEAE